MDFRNHYKDKLEDILDNERKYTQSASEIDEAIDNLTDHGPWANSTCMHGTR